MSSDKFLIEKRLELLRNYLTVLLAYLECDRADREVLRSRLNRDLMAVRAAVMQAGTLQRVTISPPPAVGGMIHQNINPFDNLFVSFFGRSVIPFAIDSIEQAIGVYEHALESTGLVRLRTDVANDIETAVRRALRPSFRHEPPSDERDVQDAIEVILRSLGIEFVRDAEIVKVGAKSFKPDFVVPSHELAIEVKFARAGRTLAAIQEEISADAGAYRVKWPSLLFIVYDCGVITDPHNFQLSNTKSLDIRLIIVKH